MALRLRHICHKIAYAMLERAALLYFVLLIISEMQENKTEDNDSKHHGKGSCIVRIRRHDEPFVLRVLQWTN